MVAEGSRLGPWQRSLPTYLSCTSVVTNLAGSFGASLTRTVHFFIIILFYFGVHFFSPSSSLCAPSLPQGPIASQVTTGQAIPGAGSLLAWALVEHFFFFFFFF
jgi:hypothetical protein